MKLKTILRMHTFHMHPRLGNISKDRSALVFGFTATLSHVGSDHALRLVAAGEVSRSRRHCLVAR